MDSLKAIPFGNYYLLERLAVGGMAEVYLAKGVGLAGGDRVVALKRILPSIAEDDEFIAMFIDEAKIAGQLNHPNIAQIFDLGKIRSSYFIAMEYISGHDLRALWERLRERDGGMDLALAGFVTRRICEGLDYAHRRRDNRGRPLGIIHRDVSPQNILLGYDGAVSIIDFGIAKAANRMVRTQTGILKGKFAYMAPEQARGELIDHRSDIFAIGVIFYELLTGERAFKAETDFGLLEKVRKVDIVMPRKIDNKIPKDLERIVVKAMSQTPQERYVHASDMAADIERAMQAHNLVFNKNELGACVRTEFKEDYEEEQRRLRVYEAYEPTGKKRVRKKPPLPPGAGGPDPGIFEAGTLVAPVEGISALRSDASGFENVATQLADDPERTHVSAEEPPFAASDFGDDTFSTNKRPPPSTAQVSSSVIEAVRPASTSDDRSYSDERSISDETVVDSPVISGQGAVRSVRDTLGAAAQGPMPVPGPPPAHARGPGSAKEERYTTKTRAAPARAGWVAAVASVMFVIGAVLGLVVGGMVLSSTPDVVVVVDPAETQVLEGQQLLCKKTPCALALGEGRHELVFMSEGHEALSKSVEVKPDEVARVQVDLPREKTGVKVDTVPPGAKVELNGKKLSGDTPLTVPRVVVGDPVRLTIRKDGYITIDEKLPVPELKKGDAWTFELQAAATVYDLAVEPKDAVVEARNNRTTGESTVTVKHGERLPVLIERPGCTRQLHVLEGTGVPKAKEQVVLECRPFDAKLTIMSKSRIYAEIDGVDVGRRWVANYELPAGQVALKIKGRRSGEQVLVELPKDQETQVPTAVR